MNQEKGHSASALKAIISGGGTGGHLFPALAIAKQLQEDRPGTEILFIGAKGRMEMEKIPKNGFPIKGLWISGYSRGALLKNLLLPFKVLSSLVKSWWIIRSFKPDIAIGTGGFASAPLLYIASKMKVPTLIQEQNFFPGITNRILGRTVDTICVVYKSLEQYFNRSKMVVTGNPVRNDLTDTDHSKEEARQNFGLAPDKKTFFVLGGSLGARSINDALKMVGREISNSGVQGIWQTGKLYLDEVEEALKGETQNHLAIQAFIDDMPQAYQAADLVISRAGAITLAELAYLGKPAILVPSPNVAEDHQTKNAQAMVQEDAALMLKDAELENHFKDYLLETIQDEDKLAGLSINIKDFARPEATRNIVKEALKILKSSGRN